MAQIQVLASWVSPEASILGLQLDTFLLCLQLVFLLRSHISVS